MHRRGKASTNRAVQRECVGERVLERVRES